MNYENHSTEMLIREITGKNPSNLPRLREIARNPYLLDQSGLGKRAARRIEAALELGKRCAAEPEAEKPMIAGPEDVAAVMAPKLRDLDHERFYVLLLDNAGRVTGEILVSLGTVNASLVHPREVFKEAVRRVAGAVILVHNHPSGGKTPSREDHAITKQLVEAGKLLDIPVRDHVIICGDSYVSFAEQGWILGPSGLPF